MSDSTVHNMFDPGEVSGRRLAPGYPWPGYADPGNFIQRAKCTQGETYTLSCVMDVEGEVCFGFYLTDGTAVRPYGYEYFGVGAKVVRTLKAPEGAEYVVASWSDGQRRPMLVEGTTPAAWAPAEGEELAGGGCSHER